MNVLVIQPGFPAEIPYFTRGLRRRGARVLGIGDLPKEQLPAAAKEGLHAYLRVPGFWQPEIAIKALKSWQLPLKLDRIECLWEPGMELAAHLRETFGLSGMGREQTRLFRDKEVMKKALDAAGIRTPRHFCAQTENQCYEAARVIGYPLIVKPISGAGSAHTYKVDDLDGLREVLPRLRHQQEISIEEFIEGKEFTFDTICADGKILYYNIAWYRPNVLIARTDPWVSPQTITLRDMDTPEAQKGLDLGRAVLRALDFRTGFTHMEWFLKPNGEAVFGEIAARPPGGRSVELMNYGCDIDVFEGWAEALLQKRFTQKVERKYNAAVIFKRAHGEGRICRILGLEEVRRRFGAHIAVTNFLPVGAPRRNWKQTLISDGYLILRHPDLNRTVEMLDFVAKEVQLYAAP